MNKVLSPLFSLDRNIEFPERDSLSGAQKFLCQKIRLVSLVFLSFLLLSFELLQDNFILPSLSIPIYTAFFLVFTINASALFFDDILKSKISHGFLIFIDTALISFLIYKTQLQAPLFFVFYFFNILTAALVFGKKGSFIVSAWQGLVLVLVASSLEIFSKNTYFILLVNEVSFFGFSILTHEFLKRSDFLKKQLENEILKVHTLLDFNRVIVENSLLGFLACDEKGKVISMNEKAKREWDFLDISLGFSKSWPELWSSLKENPRGLSEFKVEDRVFEIHWNEFQERTSGQRGFVLIFDDRTKLKEMEIQVRHKEKLAAMGQLSAGLAHEIRNPLASISGSLQMLSQLELQDDEKRLLLIVLREFDRLDELVGEFLDFSRYDEKEDEEISVNKLVHDSIQLVSEDIRNVVNHKLDLASKIQVYGHSNKLKQALLNILLNCYQSMENRDKSIMKISSYDEENAVVLKIEDTGCGMSEDKVGKIFDPFYTTKSKGTGLGLSITHQILTHNKVEIFVKSKENEGTVFYLYFKNKNKQEGRGEKLG